MPLTAQERLETGTQYMRDAKCPGAVTKPDLGAAITAVDTWLDDNLLSLNAALPQPFKGAASTAQKYELLMYCLLKRMGRL